MADEFVIDPKDETPTMGGADKDLGTQMDKEDKVDENAFENGNERDSLKLLRIDNNDTIADMVEKINKNFQNIAQHGGGPSGVDGVDGIDGLNGTLTQFIFHRTSLNKLKKDEHYPSDDTQRNNLFDKVSLTDDLFTFKTHKWSRFPVAISKDYKNVFVWTRIKKLISSNGASQEIYSDWIYAPEPVLWAHWGNDFEINSLDDYIADKFTEAVDMEGGIFHDFVRNSEMASMKNELADFKAEVANKNNMNNGQTPSIK